uniref:ATXR3 C-terminal domain-containing protein n=1 Tax=Leersia perrieri TaxID=77586 RepID=A0A0D9X509_9ORYZ
MAWNVTVVGPGIACQDKAFAQHQTYAHTAANRDEQQETTPRNLEDMHPSAQPTTAGQQSHRHDHGGVALHSGTRRNRHGQTKPRDGRRRNPALRCPALGAPRQGSASRGDRASPAPSCDRRQGRRKGSVKLRLRLQLLDVHTQNRRRPEKKTKGAHQIWSPRHRIRPRGRQIWSPATLPADAVEISHDGAPSAMTSEREAPPPPSLGSSGFAGGLSSGGEARDDASSGEAGEILWSDPRFFGTPMMDAVLNNYPLDKKMVHWLKTRSKVFLG